MTDAIINAILRLFVNDLFVHNWKRFFEKYVRRPLNESRGRFWKNRVKRAAKTARIHGDVVISAPKNLIIEDYVRIGRNCYLSCEGGLTIGENSQLSRNIVIYTNNHNFEADCVPYDDTNIRKPVVIGKSVWIGMNVCITPGVSIGDGAIIGMGTVISKDVPPGAIVVGGSQRVIRHRDMKRFADALDRGTKFGKLYPDA